MTASLSRLENNASYEAFIASFWGWDKSVLMERAPRLARCSSSSLAASFWPLMPPPAITSRSWSGIGVAPGSVDVGERDLPELACFMMTPKKGPDGGP